MTGGRRPARPALLGLVAALIFAACASDRTHPESTATTPATAEQQPALDAIATTLGAVEDPIELGTFTGTEIWVDPVAGDDDHDGRTRGSAMRTIDAAWQHIPANTELTTGFRVRLVAGDYSQASSVNYWENRRGTEAAPIIVEAADGPHTARMDGDINMYGVSHFSLIGVDIIRDGDTFHCERCDHILLRDLELDGGAQAHDNLKVNQSQHVYVEGVDVHGADDNAIDFVAVQDGHVTGSRIHDAVDWCAYAKGGSASITFSANEVYNCGTGGITAGQGTGFEFMVAPWLNYEAYGISIVNNVVHDTQGAGLGVAGGYDVVLAYNTLYAVGARSHVLEIVRGRRGCDGLSEQCAENHDAGGWGSTATEEQMIPDRHVYVYNNVVLNPAGTQSQWQQFQIDAPVDPPAASGVPSPSTADDDLRIVGNVIWNGPPQHPLGAGDGCPDANPTCNATQLVADNAINRIEPRLRNPANGDYRLDPRVALPEAVAMPDLAWEDTPLPVPAGPTRITIPSTWDGTARTPNGPPGAG